MGIGIARKQRVFATKEHTKGALTFPNGTTDFIRPAGNATINQDPSFTDSEELKNTLDVLDQFTDAMPPGAWNLAMYLRPAGLGNNPQGSVLLECLLGDKNEATTASLSVHLTAASTAASYRKLAGGSLPTKGILLVDSEYIHYSGLTESNATQGQFTGLTRGYSGTAAIHLATSSNVQLKSVFYKEATDCSTFSLWVETDHFVQGLSGCTVAQGTLSLDNKGGAKITFNGEGMEMVWAGTSALSTNTAASDVTVTVDDASIFSAGAYIQNSTKGDNRSGSGYSIVTSNATTNQLILANAISEAWATDDVICGYLPTETAIGTAIENRDTAILVNEVSTTIKKCDLNIGCPKQYVADEIGTDYPEDFMGNVRDINATLGIYFREADAKYFSEGKAGNQVPITVTFGDTAGYKAEVYMKKCRLKVPQVTFNAPAVELSIAMKALGTDGEDSLEFCFN